MADAKNTNVNTPPKSKKKKKKRMSKGLTVFLTVFLICFMIGVVTACTVALSVFSDLGFIGDTDITDDIAGVDYIDLDEYIANQSQTTIVYAYDENENEVEIARLHGSENRIWVELEDTGKYLVDATIAIEDKRFLQHKGVDWIRTTGVVFYDFIGRGGAMQGGSTITQQLIKNLTGDNKRTFVRKYREIRNALALEKHFSKNEILEAYLNTIYLDMGCYGIKTGAEYYFNKEVEDLTLMESAMLISITNAPRKYNPIINPDLNRSRALQCLGYMLEQGKISQDEYDAAIVEKVNLVGNLNNNNDDDDEDEEVSTTETEYQSYYVDFIIDSVIEDFMSQYGYTENEAWRKVYYGGLKIYSAVDMNIQEEMEDVYYNRVTFPNEEEGADAIQSAMTIVDYEGRLMGIVGRLGPKQGNRCLNIAADAPRQPGSSIKPLSCYAPAIEYNYYTWSSYLPNYGILLNGRVWPTNYGGDPGNPNELLNFPEAIAPSKNTIPARIVASLTPERCYFFLRDNFHISTLVSSSDIDYAPMAIGAMTNGVTTLEMAAAYATFGNGGLYYKPWCYYKVTNASGSQTLLEPHREGEQVISQGTADVMNHLLQTVVTSSNGTGARFYLDRFTSYSKSGTTSDNRDKWIVGASPYYVCAAWTGFEDNRVINTSYYGSNPAGTVYREVMNRIHKNLDAKEFEYTGEAVRRSFCTKTGLLAGYNCSTVSSGWYKIDYMPGVCTSCGTGGSGSGVTTVTDSETPTQGDTSGVITVF